MPFPIRARAHNKWSSTTSQNTLTFGNLAEFFHRLGSVDKVAGPQERSATLNRSEGPFFTEAREIRLRIPRRACTDATQLIAVEGGKGFPMRSQ